MPELMHSQRRWIEICQQVIKVASVVCMVLSLVYLATAGVMYAVLGAVFDTAQREGTVVLVPYLLVMFLLFFLLGLFGLRLSYDRFGTRPVFVMCALAAAGAVLGIATSYFGIKESAFDHGFVGGVNLVLAVLAVIVFALAVQVELFDREHTRAEALADGEYEYGDGSPYGPEGDSGVLAEDAGAQNDDVAEEGSSGEADEALEDAFGLEDVVVSEPDDEAEGDESLDDEDTDFGFDADPDAEFDPTFGGGVVPAKDVPNAIAEIASASGAGEASEGQAWDAASEGAREPIQGWDPFTGWIGDEPAENADQSK